MGNDFKNIVLKNPGLPVLKLRKTLEPKGKHSSKIEIVHLVQTADPILTVQAVSQLIGCRLNFVLTALYIYCN